MVLVTTSEYWSVTGPDGVDHPLSTPAYNIETWGDDRQKPPAFRGGNLVVPLSPGETYVPKIADAQTKTLAGWVLGESDSGVNIVGSQRKQQFHNNWAMIRSWFAREGQFTITKRWIDTAGVFRTATALVEFAGGLSPAVFSPSGAKFTVDIHFADPYFYGPAVSIAFDTSATGSYAGTILGDAVCRKITMAAAAKPTTNTLTNPQINVTSVSPTQIWYLHEVIAASTPIACDFGAQSIILGTTFNASADVVHQPSVEWLKLNPGAYTFVIGSLVNNWSGTLTYVPTYF